MRKLLLSMMVAGSLFPAAADAHGVRTHVTAGDTTVVTVTHEDGEPLAGASFTVRAPGSALPYSEGTTDARGRVVFHPDRPGDWRVRVATADGHGAVVTVAIAPSASVATPSTVPRPIRALGGGLLLVGLIALGARLVRGRAR